MTQLRRRNEQQARRGVVVVQVAVVLTLLLGFVALTIDVGTMYNTKAELQLAADSAALAGAAVLLTESGVNPEASISVAQSIAGAHQAAGEPVTLATGDIEIGRYSNPLDLTAEFIPMTDNTANTVWVTAAREEAEGNGVGLLFAGVFGRDVTTITAKAAASLVPVATADSVPISLRAPGFGAVDPDVTAANPGKDGPSYPDNGTDFQIGEPVEIFCFGHGPMPPAHLTLDLPDYHGVAETNKMLSGEMPPAEVSIGDEMPVWNEGTGDGNFGEKLYDRLENFDSADDTIIMPLVQIIPGVSRSVEPGPLDGDVQIVDFVGVRLLGRESDTVYNPKFPGDPSKMITVEKLVGVVVPVVVSGGADTGLPNGFANGVVALQIVR